MASMGSHKLRYTVMVNADKAGDSTFGVYSEMTLADEMVLLLQRQGIPARTVTIWPDRTGKTIIERLRNLWVDVVALMASTPAAYSHETAAGAAEAAKSDTPPADVPILWQTPERTTYTKVVEGDSVAVDRRTTGLFPAIKRLPKNTEWMTVEKVNREKKRGSTTVTILVTDTTTGKIVALKWDAPNTAITTRKAN